MGMNTNIPHRISAFFILIGCVLLVLFIATIVGEYPRFFLLATSAAAFFLGYLFHQRRPPSEPTRFSAIRKVNQRVRKHQEDKQNDKAENK
jgi:predicted membrane channel-forming protein YqfA (hemolysin III family)